MNNDRIWAPGASIDNLIDQVLDQLGSGPESGVNPEVPTRQELAQLVDAAFWASLHTEEGRQVRSRLLFRPNQTAFVVPFTTPCALSTKDLVRLSTTGDRGRRDLIVDRADGELRLTGFCDTEIARPGSTPGFMGWMGAVDNSTALRVAILGPGYLRVSGNAALFCLELCRGELRHSRHLHTLPFVFEWYEEAASSFGHAETSQEVEELRGAVRYVWARILRQVSRSHHGGCFVVQPVEGAVSPPLKHNYGLSTSCLRDALADAVDAHLRFERAYQADPQFNELAPVVRLNLPRVADFVASLAAVDGAVILNRDLTVDGFGAELRATESRDHDVLEFQGVADPPQRRSLENLGMRHRSAAYYCNQTPGSMAFVVSQDGQISVFRRGDGGTERHLVTNTAEWLGTEE